jgi:hypothetical protein
MYTPAACVGLAVSEFIKTPDSEVAIRSNEPDNSSAVLRQRIGLLNLYHRFSGKYFFVLYISLLGNN